jgi:hypothetical protein
MNPLLSEVRDLVHRAIARSWITPAPPPQLTGDPKARESRRLKRAANIARGLTHNGRPRSRGLHPELVGLKGQAYDTKYKQLRRSGKLFRRSYPAHNSHSSHHASRITHHAS